MTQTQLMIFPVLVAMLTLSNLLWQAMTAKDWGKALERSFVQGVTLSIYVVLCILMGSQQAQNSQKTVTIHQTSVASNSPNISGVSGDVAVEGGGPSVTACQDGVMATIKNVGIVPVQSAGEDDYLMVVFDQKTPNPSIHSDEYFGHFLEASSLKIDGKVSSLSDLPNIHSNATAEIHMLVPNGKCSGWKGHGTFTSIEVTTKKQ